jgi:putative membrane protein
MSQSDSNRNPNPNPSFAKGLAAGLIGGLIGVVAKTLAERMFPPRTQGEPDPREALAQKAAGHALAPATKATAAEGIHWTFGAATGAAYGALAEFYPAATAKEGAAFGMALESLTHEKALPALGISLPVGDQTTRERVSELTSHVVFGLTVEFVRRTVRKIL